MSKIKIRTEKETTAWRKEVKPHNWLKNNLDKFERNLKDREISCVSFIKIELYNKRGKYTHTLFSVIAQTCKIETPTKSTRVNF